MSSFRVSRTIVVLYCYAVLASVLQAQEQAQVREQAQQAVGVQRGDPPPSQPCPDGNGCGLDEAAECDPVGQPCASHLECVVTEGGSDRTATEVTTATTVYRCACKEKRLACGSDNRTYSNACQLNEAAVKLGSNGSSLLWVQYWGPCQSAPIIRSVPKNLAGSLEQPIVFDCEVHGYPVPSVSWQFTDTYGITRWLPGDDTQIAIQTRGGPDRFTVSSWVQIMEFRPNHAGNYTCLGINSMDTISASAILEIRKTT